METPYDILGVDETADDETIKKAYLAKVREFPPDHAGAAFGRIRGSFELIATERDRRRHRLFHRPPVELADLIAALPSSGRAERPDAATLIAALTEAAAAFSGEGEDQP